MVLGLQPREWLTLIGIVSGPIIAVIITLVVQAKRRARDLKLEVFRAIMTTRHLVGDPSYSNAINMIPWAFEGSRRVKAAYRVYMRETHTDEFTPPSKETAEQIKASQKLLIVAMGKDLGFALEEEDLQAYAADSLVQRDNLVVSAHRAWIDIAHSLHLQTRLLLGEDKDSILGLQNPTPPNPPEPKEEK